MLRSQADEAEFTNFAIGFLVFLVALWALLSEHVSKRCKFLGEGSIACLLGLFAGLNLFIFSSAGSQDMSKTVEKDMLVFNASVFFTYLLPPVIFYAGISVEKQRFLSNITSILAYGVVGTFICFTILGFSIHYMSFATISLQDSLALAAVFAATDSVATLQVLNPDSMPLLFSLVFGEGVMNDATSVVLLRALSITKEDSSIISQIFSNFAYLFITSLAFGGASGLLIAWALKKTKGLGPHQELALVGLLGYLSYLVGEVLSLSGILTLFCCGLVVSHYALHNVSTEGRGTILTTSRMLSTISEGSIFIYVGMDALAPLNWQKAQPGTVLWLFLGVMLVLFISRAAFIFPISLLHNYWSSDKLSSRDMVIIWWAGLIRGAVSVALAYYQFDSRSNQKAHSTYIVTTLLVVLATVLGLGAVTKPLLELMLREVPGQSLAEALRDIPEVVRWSGSGSGGRSARVAGSGKGGRGGGWKWWWGRKSAGYKALGEGSDAGTPSVGNSEPATPTGSQASPTKVVHASDVARDNDVTLSRDNTDKEGTPLRSRLEFGTIDDASDVEGHQQLAHKPSNLDHVGGIEMAPSTSAPSTSHGIGPHLPISTSTHQRAPDAHLASHPSHASLSNHTAHDAVRSPATPFAASLSGAGHAAGTSSAANTGHTRSKSTLSSMLYDLWCTFDVEYMQPLFGSPPQDPVGASERAGRDGDRDHRLSAEDAGTVHHAITMRAQPAVSEDLTNAGSWRSETGRTADRPGRYGLRNAHSVGRGNRSTEHTA